MSLKSPVDDLTALRVDLFEAPLFDNLRLAPDGERLAWLAAVDGISQIWVGDVADPARTGHPITDCSRPVHFHTWAPDGTGILHVDDPTGAETWQLFHTGLRSSASIALTPQGRHADILARSWHQPDDILINVDNPETGLPDAIRYTFSTGESAQSAANPGNVDAWFSDSGFHVRAATAPTADGGFDLLHREAPLGEWSTVLHVNVDEALTTIVVSLPTANRIVLITALDADTTQLVDLDTRTGDRTRIGGTTDADVARVLVDPTTGEPQAYSVNTDRHRWFVLDPAISTDLNALTLDAKFDLRIIDRDRRDERWLVAHDAADRPSSFSIWDRCLRQLRPMVHDRPRLNMRTLSPVTPIRITARDDMLLHGYSTEPLAGSRPFSTVLLIHGGPWWRDLWEFDPMVQWLSALGYATLQVNFRGSAGRGKALLNAGSREWGGAILNDLVDSIDNVVEAGISDPRHIVAMGSSFGGYAALMLATTDRVAGAIAHAAPTDLVAFLNAIPADHPNMRHLWTTRAGDVTDPDERLRLVQQSPLTHVGAIRRPVLLAHGQHDTRVLPSHSGELAQQLRLRGTDVDHLVFPDEGHEIQNPANLGLLADRVAALLGRINEQTET